jgi:hypothetical protein
MATWSPISGVMSQYDKSAAAGSGPANGYYLKFYDITNTAISMASASDGSGLLLKAQLDSSGYPVNGSDARFIPFIDQNYRPALYTNATDADANTIANADWFPGTTPQLVTGSNQAENVLSRDTLNDAVIDTSLQAGLVITVSDRGASTWDVVLSSSVTANTYNIVQCTGVATLSLVLMTPIAVYVEQFGAVFDYTTGATSGFTDNAVVLEHCHQYAATNNLGAVYPKDKKSVISPTFGTSDESTGNTGTSIQVCFNILDNQVIAFNGSTLIMADDQSSNGTPVDTRVFFSNTPKTNVFHDGGTIDLNGANNSVNGTNKTQFAFGYSGTQGGIAARGDNHRLTNMKYINNAGVTFVAGGQTNTQGTTLGKNWYISNCEFRNGGLDSSDHSSLFAWFTDSEIINNTFESDLPFNTTTNRGGLVACELHGSNLLFHGNYINNYYQGIWVSSNNSDTITRGFVVTSNRALVGKKFCDFYSRNVGSAATTVDDSFVYETIIANNHVTMLDVNQDETVRGVFEISASRGAVGVKICNNSCVVQGTTADTVMVRLTVAANVYEAMDLIDISDNQCSGGLTTGVSVFWNADSTIGRLSVRGNEFGTYVTPSVLVNKDLYMFGGTAGDVDTLDVDFRNTTSANIQTDNPTHGVRAKVRGDANLDIEPTLTNITQGNGTYTYKTFIDSHSGMVNIASMFTLGSTSTVDGPVSIGISEVSSSFASIGIGAAIRGAAMYPLVANNDVTGANFSLNDSGGACDATNPITFTTADVIKITASYYADFVSV